MEWPDSTVFVPSVRSRSSCLSSILKPCPPQKGPRCASPSFGPAHHALSLSLSFNRNTSNHPPPNQSMPFPAKAQHLALIRCPSCHTADLDSLILSQVRHPAAVRTAHPYGRWLGGRVLQERTSLQYSTAAASAARLGSPFPLLAHPKRQWQCRRNRLWESRTRASVDCDESRAQPQAGQSAQRP